MDHEKSQELADLEWKIHDAFVREDMAIVQLAELKDALLRAEKIAGTFGLARVSKAFIEITDPDNMVEALRSRSDVDEN